MNINLWKGRRLMGVNLMDKCFVGLKVVGCEVFTGKVCEMIDLGQEALAVRTDRLSGFDVVISPVPKKGYVLNRISELWFNKTAHIVPNCMISTSMHEISKRINVDNFGDLLEGRSMLVRKATPLKIECVVRGYISGSGWKEYKQLGTICGIKLPSGLVESDKLPEPIFTPSTKAPAGEHDENISFEEACKIIGEDLAVKVRDLSLALYNFGYEYALERGIIIADTKFEFGILNGEVILIDEVLTPDSSRFWPVATYKPGGAQESFDKQYVRDYLQQLCNEGKWDKTNKNVPELPRDVVEVTTKKYLEALRILRS